MSLENKINILFVAFEFPPLGGGGVQRSMKFVKYLSQNGINPIVITIKCEDYSYVMPGNNLDESLLNEFTEEITIERIHCNSIPIATNILTRWAQIYFSVSEDFKKTWKLNLERALPEIIKKYKPVAVYVTLPPFAMGSLWRKLIKPYGLPLIFDFRDAWTQWCVQVNGTYFHYLAKKIAERKTLISATEIICTSSQIKDDLIRVHPIVKDDKITVITNGFDEDVTQLTNYSTLKKNKCIIGYVGNFYFTPESREAIFRPWWKRQPHRILNFVPRKEDWLYRSPYFFFKAIRLLLDNHPEFNEKIEIRFAGNTPKWLVSQIEFFKLEKYCVHKGYLNHQQVIEFQKECDALLITSSKVIGGKDYSIAGKTFEYFTIGKPILAFVSEGAQKDILVNSGMSIIFDPDDVINSVRKLKEFLKGEISLESNRQFIMMHHRKFLTEQLSKVIRRAISKYKENMSL